MTLPNRVSKPGPVIDYLMNLLSAGAEGERVATDARNAVRNVLATPDGRMVLELLEKSTTNYFLAPTEDSCALAALNAQRFIALDLRRIASNELDAAMERQKDVLSRRRAGRGARGGSPSGSGSDE